MTARTLAIDQTVALLQRFGDLDAISIPTPLLKELRYMSADSMGFFAEKTIDIAKVADDNTRRAAIRVLTTQSRVIRDALLVLQHETTNGDLLEEIDQVARHEIDQWQKLIF